MNKINELEIYACIDGFPNYLVTSYGRVLSLKDENEKYRILELKQSKNKGYLRVGIYKDNKRYNKSVHQLVAQSFIPNPDNKHQVNHIDENKTNNHVSNLEWVTAKENCNHGTRNKRVSISNKGKKLSEEHKQKISSNHANFKENNHPFYGKHHTEQSKQKMSEAHKGKKHSEETKKKMSESHLKNKGVK